MAGHEEIGEENLAIARLLAAQLASGIDPLATGERDQLIPSGVGPPPPIPDRPSSVATPGGRNYSQDLQQLLDAETPQAPLGASLEKPRAEKP